MLLLLSIVVACAARAPDGASRADDDPGPARSAIGRSLPFLLADGRAWMDGRVHVQEGSACVSCHHVTFALWSHNSARDRGIEVDEAGLRQLALDALAFFADKPDSRKVDSVSQLMLAGAPELSDPPELVHTYGAFIVDQQSEKGSWEAEGQFPFQNRPGHEANEATSMWAVLALADAVGDTPAHSRTRAVKWLQEQTSGETSEWLALRMVVEREVGSREASMALQEELLAAQRSDGGWGWRLENESDAFATGQVLYALHRVGVPSGDPAVQTGRRYLIHSQQDDGTWLTPSARVSQTASEDRDYIYKYWGTAWAAIGLAHSLPAQ